VSSTLSNFKREFGISLNILQQKISSSHIDGGTLSFFLSCGGKLGVPCELRRGTQEHVRVVPGKLVLICCWKGNLRILLEALGRKRAASSVVYVNCVLRFNVDGYVWEVFGSHKGYQLPVRISSGNVGFLLRLCSGNIPHLSLRADFYGYSLVVARSLGSLSICDGDLLNMMVLLQGSQVSFRVEGEPRDSPRGATEK